MVDLSAATLIDCATVGALLAALEPLRGDDRASVALVAADGVVTRVLTLLRLDRLFDVFPDRAAAERHVTRVKRFRHEGWRDVQLLGAHVAASPS